MIGALAAAEEPDRFAHLVMVGPSPRYIDDEGYVGGFSREDIEGLLESMDSNFIGWAGAMAPVIMGNEDRPELGEEWRGPSAARTPSWPAASPGRRSSPTTAPTSPGCGRRRSSSSAPTT
jgi:sigma-B regulation protein RsbQ